MDRPGWAFSETAVIYKYFEDSAKRVFVIEGLDHHFDALPLFAPKDLFLVTIPCHTTEWNFRFARECLIAQNPNAPIEHFIFLANTAEQLEQAVKNGFSSILFNQNALLNEDVYILRPGERRRKYRLVLNTRPEKEFKRPHLAKRVADLAIIKGYNFRKNDYFNLETLKPSYINDNRLTTECVVSIYNESMVGGIFSSKEGACYSSSEYLLCGLPVISTPSEGGRDVWYNKYNSIISEPTEEAISHSVSLAIRMLDDGIFNRNRIRSMHIAKQHEMRTGLCDFLANLLSISTEQSFRLLKHNLGKANKLQAKVPMLKLEEYINKPYS
jgi:hypothetical protein